MKKLVLGIAGLTAAFSMGAIAQNTSPPARSDTAPATGNMSNSSSASGTVQFNTVDQNKDGRISRAEAASQGTQLGGAFATLDANSDTYLSQSEFGKWKSGMDHSKGDMDHSKPANTLPPSTAPGTGTAPPRTTP